MTTTPTFHLFFSFITCLRTIRRVNADPNASYRRGVSFSFSGGEDTTEHAGPGLGLGVRKGKGKGKGHGSSSVKTNEKGKRKKKQVEGGDGEEVVVVVMEDKMPPEMRKKWIHQSADALRDMLESTGR